MHQKFLYSENIYIISYSEWNVNFISQQKSHEFIFTKKLTIKVLTIYMILVKIVKFNTLWRFTDDYTQNIIPQYVV